MKSKSFNLQIIPVMLAFLAMGAVDLVGIASNYVKKDFALTDTVINSFTSAVFLWFFIFAVPTGLLMNKIGRRKTVLLSLVVTALGLLIPSLEYNFSIILISFSLLGIGNTIMQVSLNPLISNVVNGDKLASSLTLGQFVKAIASFSGPIIAQWGALHFGNWRLLFPIYAATTILSFILLGVTKIKEAPSNGKKSSFVGCFRLLGNQQMLLFFIGILAHVGIDMGINISAPKIMMERLGITLNQAAFSTSIYFLFRVIGSLSGAFIMSRFPINRFFLISVIFMALSMVGLFLAPNQLFLYISIALVGFGNSNIFSMIFAKALQSMPRRNNEISGLMIMGIAGGAIFPPLMGVCSDFMGSQAGALMVISSLVMYLFFLSKLVDSSNIKPTP